MEKALQNDLFDIVAIHNEEVIGMGRLVGDGVMYWYLQEIIVLPEYQGKGIGTDIVNALLNHIQRNPDNTVLKCLSSTSDKKPQFLSYLH